MPRVKRKRSACETALVSRLKELDRSAKRLRKKRFCKTACKIQLNELDMFVDGGLIALEGRRSADVRICNLAINRLVEAERSWQEAYKAFLKAQRGK